MTKNSITIFTVFCFLLFVYSCNSDDKKIPLVKIENSSLIKVDSSPVLIKNLILDTKQIDSLENIALEKGDKNAFYSVEAYYEKRKEERKILTFCIMMAHKHKYNFAYYMVYVILVHQADNNLNALDVQTQNMALYYLLKSHEMGYDQAKYAIEEKFGENVSIPKSSSYLTKMIEHDAVD